MFRRDGLRQTGEEGFRFGGRQALDGVGAAAESLLSRGQGTREPDPETAVPPGQRPEQGGRQSQIAGVLGQGEGRAQGFPAAGRACGGIASGEGDVLPAEGHAGLGRQGQQVEAVLHGIQVEQDKARRFVGDADQQGHPVGVFGQRDGHAALGFGGLKAGAGRVPGQQHGAAHQGKQHQQGGTQSRPERFPSAAHGGSSSRDAVEKSLCRNGADLYQKVIQKQNSSAGITDESWA